MAGWTRFAPTVMLAAAALDPFSFFQPTVLLQPRDRELLAGGRPFARIVQAPSGHVAVFAAVPSTIDGARLAVWTNDIVELKRSKIVREIGRFSATPRLEDLAGLTLDKDDADTIAGCRGERCGIKLSPNEVATMRLAMGRDRVGPAAQQAFREVVLARALAYLAHGRTSAPPPSFLLTNWPEVGRDLPEFPRRIVSGSESFLYWAKDHFGGKPIVSVTHVTIVRGERTGDPEVLVAGRQVFATHYMDGGWSLTALMRGEQSNYLTYTNQSEIDLLDGWYGGLVRRIMERRLREEAAEALDGVRRRLESGLPPMSATPSHE